MPVIPVDIVSRAIVHTAFGWGGASEPPCGSSVASGTPGEIPGRWRAHVCGAWDGNHACGLPSVAVKDEEGIDDQHLPASSPAPNKNPSSSFRDESLNDRSKEDNLVADLSHEVLIRNAAWATHPASSTSESHRNTWNSGHALPASSTAYGGRISSPLELVWLF